MKSELPPSPPVTGSEDLARHPLISALLQRRSRRFGKGMSLNRGPLAHRSTEPPQPLSLEEEAALAFAACGITGHALAELPYRSGQEPEAGSGNIMTHFVARTVASGDAIHAVVLFVLDDDGAWMLRRPLGYPRAEVAGLIDAARRHEWTELYRRARIRIADTRADGPRQIPFVPAFNKWSANRPGTTYFLPVNEVSALYINMMLTGFGEEFAYFVVDERNRYEPAGLRRFGRSRGGHLHDDPDDGRLMTVGLLENWLYEFAAIEQGGMLQNLALMTQAVGLGGFPHFAAHPYAWFEALEFRMEPVALTRLMGAGSILRWILRFLGREMPVSTAVGLEREGEALLKPFCPPSLLPGHGGGGAGLRGVQAGGGDGDPTGRGRGHRLEGRRPGPGSDTPDRAIAATIAHCEYVHQRYGRFPASSGPFRTILARQTHHLDPGFYEEYYREDALSESQGAHDGRWHGGTAS